MKHLILLFSLWLAGSTLAVAQTADEAPKWAAWVHGGAGAGAVFEGENEFGLLRARHLGASFVFHRVMLSLTDTHLRDLRGLKDKAKNAIDRQSEQAVLLGVGKHSEKTKLFFSIGYARGKGTFHRNIVVGGLEPPYREETFTYNGVPIRITYVRVLTPWLGLGVETTANTNKYYPYLTLLGTLVLGKL